MPTEELKIASNISHMGLILEKSFNEIYIFDAITLHFIHVNEKARRNLQFSMQELRHLTPIEVLKPLCGYQQFYQLIEQLRSQQKSQLVFETLHLRKDGTRYPVEIHLQLSVYDETPVFVAIINDISERHAAQQALRESEERLRLALLAGECGVWDWDMCKDKVTWSEQLYKFHGMAPGAFGGSVEDFRKLIHPQDAERVGQALEAAITNKADYHLEFRTITPEGEVRWLSTTGQVICDNAGEAIRMMGATQDITTRKRIELELSEQTKALATLNKVGNAIAAELDLERLVQSVTDAGVVLTGAEFGAFFYNTLDEKGETYTLYSLSGVAREVFAKFPMPRQTQLFGPTFRNEGIIRVDDIKQDPRYGKNAPFYGMPPGHLPVASYLAVPVVSRSGQVLGALFFGHSGSGVFTERSETILSGIASQAAVAIDNAQLYRTAQMELAERKQAEEALFQEKEQAQITLRSIGDAVITSDAEGRITYLNPIAELLTGWSNAEAYGISAERVFNIVDEISGERAENPMEVVLREGRIVELGGKHSMLVSRSGERYSIENSAAPIRTQSGQDVGVVLVFRDVTDSRALSHRVAYQASHDSLTDLLNRREFERSIEWAIDSAVTSSKHHALLYLDLDQFKLVNDTRGHLAGDEMLRRLAKLLQEKMRESDTIARLGGDEFGILLEGCRLEDAQHFAESLIEAVRDFRFTWHDKTFAVSVSIGLVPINEDSKDLKSVLSAADTACYMAKDKGRNRLQLFHPEDVEVLRRHGEMDWITRIAHAFEENRFCLYYQKIFPLVETKRSLPHYEVLVRMKDEKGGIVPPMAFIPAAERYNMMPSVDRWVIKNLFTYLGQQHEKTNIHCSVNLSGASISDSHFLEFIIEQFKTTNTSPNLLCFEITETAAIANFERARKFMLALKALGCRFALDDFGSGLSSFRYLKELPIDYLKIDGGFVKDMVTDPVSRAIVEAIQRIGTIMQIQTVAEFVENEAILEDLRVIGINYAQGWMLHNAELLV